MEGYHVPHARSPHALEEARGDPRGLLRGPRAWTPPKKGSGARLYRGRLSLLRNTAEAGPAGERATVRITGGLTNRKYDAVFDAGDAGSLPVAFFLLYLTVALRRNAYVTESS